MGKKIVRCACGGGKAQHAVDLQEEGCWCPRCLQKPEADRCREWRPEETIRKPEVNRNVAPVGHRHGKTALDAARKALPKTGSRRHEVFRTIETAGEYGVTDDELEKITGRSHQSVSATRNSLMKDGLIEDSGRRRRTQWGNEAIAWKVKV